MKIEFKTYISIISLIVTIAGFISIVLTLIITPNNMRPVVSAVVSSKHNKVGSINNQLFIS